MRFVFAVVVAISTLPLSASLSLCDNTPGNLVQNCGFEANVSPPPDWTTFGNWGTPYNYVTTSIYIVPNSGNDDLVLGNYSPQHGGPNSGLAGVYQTITDTPGAVYQFSFWVAQDHGNINPNHQAFYADWNGVPLLSLVDIGVATGYTQYTYNVTGTGSDTIAFSGYEDSGYNHLDDVVLKSTVPEPGSIRLFLAGLVALAPMLRRRRK